MHSVFVLLKVLFVNFNRHAMSLETVVLGC